MILIFLALFFLVSIYLFYRHLSSRITEGINQLRTFCEQIYTKLKEAYQAVISFCVKLIDQISKNVLPLIENIGALSVKIIERVGDLGTEIPRKVKEEVGGVVSESLQEIHSLQDQIVREFALMRKELSRIPESICALVPFCK
jgi:phage-related protein